MIVIGLDCGSDSVVGCKLDHTPSDLVSYANKYKPLKAPATLEGVEKLSQEGDLFVIEPTGSYYLFWLNELRALGKTVKLVSGTRIRHFAIERGLQKSDREDAVAIAAFALENLQRGNSRVFINPASGELRDLYLALRTIRRSRTPIINRIRARLGREAPTLSKVAAANRQWKDEAPPALYRAIATATKPTRKTPIREAWTDNRELSRITQEFAQLACELEQMEARIEVEMSKAMNHCPAWMQAVFDAWDLPEKHQAIVLAVCMPFEQFLDENGDRITDKVWNKDGTRRNRRDRTLKRWKRVFGCGTKRIQSGNKTLVVQTGDKELVSEFRQLIDSKVIILSQPNRYKLMTLFGLSKAEWKQMSEKDRKRWIAERSFDAVIKPLARQHDEPWKVEEVIEKVMWFNGASRGFAKLQLLFKFGDWGKMKKYTIINRKLYPRFQEWLLSDLVEAYRAYLSGLIVE